MKDNKLIFEKSSAGRCGHSLFPSDIEADINIDDKYLREDAVPLPELSELDVVRHYTGLSLKNHGVDSGFYPLGSCTMKYNPKIAEDVCSYGGFANSHPLTHSSKVQGNLRLMHELSEMLTEITGMNSFSLQPAAGAHGELAGLMIISAYHQSRKDSARTKILIPDTAHGTNPASAMMAGFETVQIKSDKDGNVDLDDLKSHLDSTVAGLMLTNPSTLGLFETNIEKISCLVHEAGGLLYYDGANLNAIMGIVRPGDMGFDVVHLNLHKTFATPHGGGGPGSGPVGVKSFLSGFLPSPTVEFGANGYRLDYSKPMSIGSMRSFYGNFAVAVKAYAYILSMGANGIKAVSENAVLNANYLKKKLSAFLEIAIDRTCMHEFVASGAALKDKGISTLDIAKRMIDFGVHPPTVYFPLIVKEAQMFEPTETENMQTLDEFAEVVRIIINEADENPDILKNAPHSTPTGRLDDTKAARNPVLIWTSPNP